MQGRGEFREMPFRQIRILLQRLILDVNGDIGRKLIQLLRCKKYKDLWMWDFNSLSAVPHKFWGTAFYIRFGYKNIDSEFLKTTIFNIFLLK